MVVYIYFRLQRDNGVIYKGWVWVCFCVYTTSERDSKCVSGWVRLLKGADMQIHVSFCVGMLSKIKVLPK